jgi:hypothetical protein
MIMCAHVMIIIRSHIKLEKPPMNKMEKSVINKFTTTAPLNCFNYWWFFISYYENTFFISSAPLAHALAYKCEEEMMNRFTSYSILPSSEYVNWASILILLFVYDDWLRHFIFSSCNNLFNWEFNLMSNWWGWKAVNKEKGKERKK